MRVFLAGVSCVDVSDIRKDMAYFGRSYKKADVVVEVAGLSPQDVAVKVNEILSSRH